jgi:tetratricopeptide (TPR) repeat protein/glycosyltransferase involved in cell wall biosynthesis
MSRIIIAEYPKSGGTWIVSLLADALKFHKRDIYANEKNPGFDFFQHPWYKNAKDLSIPENSVIKSHEPANSKLNKLKAHYFHLVRDGRDVTVSKYFYEKDFCVKNGIRKSFNINFDEYVVKIAYEWRNFVISWLEAKTPIIRYEDFLSDPHGKVKKFIAGLNHNHISDEDIHHAVLRNTKEHTRKSLSKTFKSNTFVRKGISGDWKNHFSKHHIKIFETIAGEALIATGYKCQHRLRPSIANHLDGHSGNKDVANNHIKSHYRGHKKVLKIVHLCTLSSGGAAKAALRLHKGLLQAGIDSIFLTQNTTNNDPDIRAIPTGTPIDQVPPALMKTNDYAETKKLFDRWHSLMQKFPSRPSGLELFSDSSSQVNLSNIQEIVEADVIHFHWVSGILNYSELPTSFYSKPVVWTLHDMNPFTGGCHYTGNCQNYKKQCGACPQLGSHNETDLSWKVWQDKSSGFRELRHLTIVTPSQWLGDCVQQSSLMGGVRREVIPNGLPIDVFRPRSGDRIREHFDIPDASQIILFGAADIHNERKGFRYLLEALDLLAKDPDMPKNLFVMVFGNFPKNFKPRIPYPFILIGHVSDENLLSEIYSAADVFVLPSREDNLPNTAVEAMACGTPVVGFSAGGITEIISHQKTGYLSDPGNSTQLAEGIRWVLNIIKGTSPIRELCRKSATEKYARDIQVESYRALYQKALHAHHIWEADIEDDISDHIRRGVNAFRQGDVNNSEKHFEAALNINNGHSETHNNLGVLYSHSGNLDKALYHHKIAHSLSPENDNYAKNFADLLVFTDNDIPKAHSILSKLIETSPRDCEVLYSLGVLSQKQNQLEAAKSYFDRLLSIEPGNESALRFIGKGDSTPDSNSSESTQHKFYAVARQTIADGQYAKAIEELHAIVNCFPNFAPAHNDLGALAVKHGNTAEALTHYRKATEFDPENSVYQKNLADYLFLIKQDVQAALKIYLRLLEKDRTDTEVLYAIGQVSLSLGKVSDASSFFMRVFEIEPNHSAAAEALQKIRRPLVNENEHREQFTKKGILVATSIAPHDVVNQKQAIQSWIDLGFEVVSLNSPEEIAILRERFHEVKFHAVERNSEKLFGKPYVYFDDFIEFFKTVDRAAYGIVNSDIHLKANKEITAYLLGETVESLVFGHRLDVSSIDTCRGDFYRNGFDFFFFDNALLELYPESIVSIGVTWWDYWAVLIPALKGLTIKKLISPLAYHIRHENRWDRKQWKYVGRHISDHLKAEDIDKGQTWPVDSPWSIFLEILENGAAVKCIRQSFQDRTRRRFAYGDILTFNICILDFIDRIAQKTTLPWDDGFTRNFECIKGPNFFPDFFEATTNDVQKAISPRLSQQGARLSHEAHKAFQDRQLQKAKEIAENITGKIPGHPPASNLLGVMAWEAGANDRALRYFHNALRTNPYDRPTIINCARALTLVGQPDEARQIYAAYLRFNPGDLEIGRWCRELETDNRSIPSADFMLHRIQDLCELPILAYQMDKVGSTSIVNSIEKMGIPIKHAHTLSWPGIVDAEKLFLNKGKSLPSWLSPYRGLRTHIDRLGGTAHWKIITLVRDPLERYISDLFQNLDRYFPQIHDFDNSDPGIIISHILRYLEEFEEANDYACHWFDKELKAVFDFDIYAVHFDFNTGFKHYQTDRADVLVIRLENLTSCASEALGPFLSVSAFTLANANVSQTKPYALLYKRLLSALKIDRPLLDRFYNSRLAKHFYSEVEIEAFKERWGAAPPSLRTPNYRVSAIVSTYASERFIKGRLQNLVEQSLFKKGELEIIVIDSNSPENEKSVVDQFLAQHPEIIYLRTPERETVYAAWNRGIEMARGTYCVNANTDDRFAPDALEGMADVLDAHPEYDAAYGNWLFTRVPNDTFNSSTAKRLFVYPEFHPGLLFYLQITSHASFVRRSVIDKIGPFDGDYTVFGDREFMFRFSAAGHKALKLDRTVGLYLENPTSVERANKDIGMQECAALYDAYLLPDQFARLMGLDNDVSPQSLSRAYTEAGCFGMGLYQIDGKSVHALGSPTRLFARAIELDHENIEALNNMGVIAQHRQARQDALRFLEKAKVQANAKQAKVIDHNLKMVQRGITDPDKLRFLFPTDFHAIRVVESVSKSILQNPAPAINSLTASNTAKPGRKGRCQKKSGEERRSASKSPKPMPLSTPNKNPLPDDKIGPAWVNYLAEDYASALSGLETLLAADPDHWEAYELLVDILLQSGQEAVIGEKLRPLEKRSDLPARMVALVGCGYEASGHLEKTARFADQALTRDAECSRAWNLKGVVAYRKGQPAEAAQYFQRASETDHEWGDPWTNMGTLHWENGTHDKALECFEKGFQLSPTGPQCGHHLSHGCQRNRTV